MARRYFFLVIRHYSVPKKPLGQTETGIYCQHCIDTVSWFDTEGGYVKPIAANEPLVCQLCEAMSED